MIPIITQEMIDGLHVGVNQSTAFVGYISDETDLEKAKIYLAGIMTAQQAPAPSLQCPTDCTEDMDAEAHELEDGDFDEPFHQVQLIGFFEPPHNEINKRRQPIWNNFMKHTPDEVVALMRKCIDADDADNSPSPCPWFFGGEDAGETPCDWLSEDDYMIGDAMFENGGRKEYSSDKRYLVCYEPAEERIEIYNYNWKPQEKESDEKPDGKIVKYRAVRFTERQFDSSGLALADYIANPESWSEIDDGILFDPEDLGIEAKYAHLVNIKVERVHDSTVIYIQV